MATISTKRFIVLVGGPGLFAGCDRVHDQTWTNYIVPLQLAARDGLYQRMAHEQIYWLIYEPPYRNRWLDDSEITRKEKKQDDGYHLHSHRKKAADKIKIRGAVNYLSRIRQIAVKYGYSYKGVNNKDDFWNFIASCPKKSITRLWYSGHAGRTGLMLALRHDNNCNARADEKDMILTTSLKNMAKFADRFDTTTTKSSKFYGCKTSLFAKEWKRIFKVPSEGAVNKIDFGCIDRPSKIQNILKRLEKTPTSTGIPKWEKY